MAGEMSAAEVTREAYPLHFAIADSFGGEVKPFDQYQGPYVVIGDDVRIGRTPYAVAPRGLGVVRLWLCSDDGAECYIYNEANERRSELFWYDDEVGAVCAAQEVLTD